MFRFCSSQFYLKLMIDWATHRCCRLKFFGCAKQIEDILRTLDWNPRKYDAYFLSTEVPQREKIGKIAQQTSAPQVKGASCLSNSKIRVGEPSFLI